MTVLLQLMDDVIGRHCVGKQSIVLDLKSPNGKEAFERLIKKADVFVQNFRPGAMDRLGIAYV